MIKPCLSLATILLLAAGPRLMAQTAAPRAEAVTQPAAQVAGQTPSHPSAPLRPGDILDIRIAGVPLDDIQQWDSLSYTIDDAGQLNLPYIGEVNVSGLTPSAVQSLIQNKLVEEQIYTSPTVTVNPPTASRFVSIGGQVRGPGRLPYTSDLTLMSAINAAGGASDFAGDRVRLTRAGKVQIYSRKRLEKDPSKDPPIQPGDQIEVMESGLL